MPVRQLTVPVVGQEGGVTYDHKSILVRPGSADIFFPTDFPLLAHMHSHAGQQHSLASGEAA